jgi:hypothetical protein
MIQRLSLAEIDAWADAYIRAQKIPHENLADDAELWWAVFRFMLPSEDTDPEDCWSALLVVLRKTTDEWVLGMLAAGPLEDLLEACGEQFIERIEQEAKGNSTFCRMLHQIYPSGSPEVWKRVELAKQGCSATQLQG